MDEIPQAEQELLARAERRLGQWILVLAVLGTGVAAWRGGGRLALAVALGAGLAYLNYRWIVAVVDALMRAQSARLSRAVYLKLFLPVVLLAALLYVIFSRSWISVAGFLGGLSFLVVGALLEGLYELYLGLRN